MAYGSGINTIEWNEMERPKKSENVYETNGMNERPLAYMYRGMPQIGWKN